jgi:Arc/MetJ family transcription regulator
MKTTIDIPEKVLLETIKHTGAKSKSEAVVTALKRFNKFSRLASLEARIRGTFKDFMTQDDLKKMRGFLKGMNSDFKRESDRL